MTFCHENEASSREASRRAVEERSSVGADAICPYSSGVGLRDRDQVRSVRIPAPETRNPTLSFVVRLAAIPERVDLGDFDQVVVLVADVEGGVAVAEGDLAGERNPDLGQVRFHLLQIARANPQCQMDMLAAATAEEALLAAGLPRPETQESLAAEPDPEGRPLRAPAINHLET